VSREGTGRGRGGSAWASADRAPGDEKTPCLTIRRESGGFFWRYRWDLNPRCSFKHTTFRELHLRPLGHGTGVECTRPFKRAPIDATRILSKSRNYPGRNHRDLVSRVLPELVNMPPFTGTPPTQPRPGLCPSATHRGHFLTIQRCGSSSPPTVARSVDAAEANPSPRRPPATATRSVFGARQCAHNPADGSRQSVSLA
jgi:hypothetical protein